MTPETTDKTSPTYGKHPPRHGAGRVPDASDILARLHFSPNEGRIRLDDQRMLLIHSSALGVLRRELIETLGLHRARGLLTRMGYNSGARDAALARRIRPTASLHDMFATGPQLHALEGIVQVETISLEIDVERGVYHGDFLWKDSSEDEEHVRVYGIGAEPACWMQLGYASGYTSVFMGRPILYREIECRAMGQSHCRIVGMPADEWLDAEEDLHYLRAESFTRGISIAAPRAKRLDDIAAAEDPSSILSETDIVGASVGFNAVCHMVKRVADTRATVLFTGESGVGKEVFARAVHRISPRAGQPFVAVNCAAIPENLVEAELFGVERGAFTGATVSRTGRFERAHGGTLFLDEIGILGLTAQGKLLRALQEGEIERVGDTQTRKVDVRLVAATNLDLRKEVAEGRFREDLFFRLNVFPIHVAPLRERREDIPVFMNHFLRKFCERHGRNVEGFTERAINALLGYSWPGNIRELENMVERGVILAPEGGAIDVGHMFSGGELRTSNMLGLGGDGMLTAAERCQKKSADDAGAEASRITKRIDSLFRGDESDLVSLDEIETALLKRAVQNAEGNLSAAARILGLTRAQMAYRLKSRGMTLGRG